MESERPRFKVGEGWIGVEVRSEPQVVQTVRGYAPYLEVVEIGTGLDYDWLIGAKSISDALEPKRISNDGSFVGLRLNVRRASKDRMAPYEIEQL